MSQTDTTQIGIDKETENYAVFESADGESIVGMYVSEGAAKQIGEYGALTISDEGDGVAATLDKVTANYGVYSTEGGAVSGIYADHDLLEAVGGESGEEEFDAPESIGLLIEPSDEESFEDAQGADEAEEEALVASSDEDDEPSTEDEETALVAGTSSAGSEADDSPSASENESESEESESEESEDVGISDDEIGL